ncbi:MAG: zf-HC2 domain-containing protein [Terriglobales bacterium]
MACEAWIEKLDAYFDGELPADEGRALQQHLRECSGCAAEGLARVQRKLAVKAAGQRFTPDPAFRARIEKSIASRQPSAALSPSSSSLRLAGRAWLPVFELITVAIVLLMGVALFLTLHRGRDERQLMSELIDQHVATLASANPVDVVSTDRHTVKPWFEGKIPFSFNLPELQGSPFVLVGGKVCYVNQSPGAELIFRVRQHQISAFIFQDRGATGMRENEATHTTLAFQVRNWRHNGLRYFVIGDASPQDLDKLSELLKSAG